MSRRSLHKIRTTGFYIKVILVNLVVLFCVVKLIKFIQEPEIILGKYDDVDTKGIPPFETILKRDFPTSGDEKTIMGQTRIPRVIHQTWKNEHVPAEFQANVLSFVKHNSDFKFYFWTDKTARQLIADRHPHLLETFDNYVEPVRKADMLRYVVLYEFGGVYADLDTECLRPLEPILFKYACVISPEPYEHASLIYNTEFLVTNSIMFCRKKHPFLKQVMDALPDFSHFSQDIDGTGPNFLTYQYKKYMKSLQRNQSSDNLGKAREKKIPRGTDSYGRYQKYRTQDKGRKSNVDTEPDVDVPLLLVDELGEDYVYVPSSQYFQNRLDPVRFGQFKEMCLKYDQLNTIGKRGCVSLKFHGMQYRQSGFEFTRHSFYHTGYKWIEESPVSISELVTNVKFYNGQMSHYV